MTSGWIDRSTETDRQNVQMNIQMDGIETEQMEEKIDAWMSDGWMDR